MDTEKPIIDYISINDLFWVQFRPHLISFGYNGLPEQVHFTIAFNENSSDINIHISKNIEAECKPKITILRIDKRLIEELLPIFLIRIVNFIREPIDLKKICGKNNLWYIPLDDIDNDNGFSTIKQVLTNSFKNISKLKKSRLIIKGDIENKIQEIANSEDVISYLDSSIVKIPKKPSKPVDGGMILSKNNVLFAIRIGGTWFKVKEKIGPKALLSLFINERAFKRLIRHIKTTIESIQKAKSYEDCKHLNNPIRLTYVSNSIKS